APLAEQLARVFFFSSRSRHTRFSRDWSSDVCSSDLQAGAQILDPDIVLNPLNNYFFTTASSLLIVGLGWFLTDRVVEPRLKGTRSEERRVGKECRSWGRTREKSRHVSDHGCEHRALH